MTPNKILFVYKYLTGGGVESLLRGRIDGLLHYGLEANVWFFSYIDGWHVFPRGDPRVYIGDVYKLEEHLRSTSYDVVITIDTEEVFPIVQANRARYKLVVEAHSPYMENLDYLKFIDPDIVKFICVPSNYQASIVRSKIRHNISLKVIPNPIRDVFVQGIRPFSPSPPRPIVAWIGRFDELKNWKAFIELAPLILQSEDTEFWMVGRLVRKNQVDELYQKVKKLGVFSKFRWLNNFPHDQIPFLFDAIRTSGGVVVSTSKGESFGMAIAEALARSCSVVVPDRGPFNEFIRHEQSGLFYTPESLESAADQVLRLLKNRELRQRCGINGRIEIIKKHAPLVANGIFLDTLKGILSS